MATHLDDERDAIARVQRRRRVVVGAVALTGFLALAALLPYHPRDASWHFQSRGVFEHRLMRWSHCSEESRCVVTPARARLRTASAVFAAGMWALLLRRGWGRLRSMALRGLVCAEGAMLAAWVIFQCWALVRAGPLYYFLALVTMEGEYLWGVEVALNGAAVVAFARAFRGSEPYPRLLAALFAAGAWHLEMFVRIMPCDYRDAPYLLLWLLASLAACALALALRFAHRGVAPE